MTPGTLTALETVLASAGWAEAGGRLMRGSDGRVCGRTVWIARAGWWSERPAGLTEKRAHAVVAAALSGRPLGCRERRYLKFLVDVAAEIAGDNRPPF